MYSYQFGKDGEAFHSLKYTVLIGFNKGRCAYRQQGFRSTLHESFETTSKGFHVEVLEIKYHEAYVELTFRGHPELNLHRFVLAIQKDSQMRVQDEFNADKALWHGAYMIANTELKGPRHGRRGEWNPITTFASYLESPPTNRKA